MASNKTNTVIFDLGGVLIDWNPKYLFKKMFKDEKEMSVFLDRICTSDWNEEQDAGRTLKEATELLVSQHPEYKVYIEAYYGRWEEMLNGEIRGTVEILKEMKKEGFKLYALTNWSNETFSIAIRKFKFLQWFEGIVVSGQEKTRKPFLEFYKILLDRYSINPKEALFIDDNYRNIKAAEEIGIPSIHFQTPEQLIQEILKFGISVSINQVISDPLKGS